jgi:hypothetical protein
LADEDARWKAASQLLKPPGAWTGIDIVAALKPIQDTIDAMAPTKRPPGRTISTGSAATKLVQYRVTAAQRAELDAEAARLGLSSADLAAKLRAFPKTRNP